MTNDVQYHFQLNELCGNHSKLSAEMLQNSAENQSHLLGNYEGRSEINASYLFPWKLH